MLIDVYPVDSKLAAPVKAEAANAGCANNDAPTPRRMGTLMQSSADTQALDDAQLIQSIRAGREDLYAIVIQRYESTLLSSLRLRLERTDEAEDLAQEAFIVAYKKILEGDFDQARALGPWLRGIAINLLKNHCRKRRPVAVGSTLELEQLINTEIDDRYLATEDDHAVEALAQCLAKLDHKNQQLLDDHYKQGYSIGELTQRHGLRHSAMTMRMHRIRQKLRDCVTNTLRELTS